MKINLISYQCFFTLLSCSIAVGFSPSSIAVGFNHYSSIAVGFSHYSSIAVGFSQRIEDHLLLMGFSPKYLKKREAYFMILMGGA